MTVEFVSFLTGIFGILITALINFIKSKLNAKTLAKVEKIAAVVEQLYSDCTSTEKLTAFKDLCSAKGINIAKAVNYLEKYLIPLSKELNVYAITQSVKIENNDKVTN